MFKTLVIKDVGSPAQVGCTSCAEIGVPMHLRRVSQGISGAVQRKPSQLCCMMGNGAFL